MIINYERLLNSIKGVIRDEDIDKYDFDTILKTATPCWDNTAIMVKSSDFTMIFDKISYELRQYIGFDIK